MLVRGAISQSELLEIFFSGLRTRAQHDEGVRHLAFHFMIKRHDQRLMHGRMALEQRLDLYRKDVFTAADKHVVVAPDEIVKTVIISAADVAGVVPAITQ